MILIGTVGLENTESLMQTHGCQQLAQSEVNRPSIDSNNVSHSVYFISLMS